jgi:hypothetical protein
MHDREIILKPSKKLEGGYFRLSKSLAVIVFKVRHRFLR